MVATVDSTATSFSAVFNNGAGAWDNPGNVSSANYAVPSTGIHQVKNGAITANAGSPCGDTTAPTVPSSLTSSNVTQTGATISWTASTDNVAVTGYEIYRNGVKIGTSATASYADSGLVAGTSYSYTVLAYDAAGNKSAQSTALSVKTLSAADTSAPTVPTALRLGGVTNTSIVLWWSPSKDNVGVKQYRIYRNGVQYALASGATTGRVIPGLTAGTSYSFTVQAEDAAGNLSAQSSALSVKPRPAT